MILFLTPPRLTVMSKAREKRILARKDVMAASMGLRKRARDGRWRGHDPVLGLQTLLVSVAILSPVGTSIFPLAFFLGVRPPPQSLRDMSLDLAPSGNPRGSTNTVFFQIWTIK